MSNRKAALELTPEVLIKAYALGVFPMAESAASNTLLWFDPPLRGILPIDGFHVPRSLAKSVRQGRFEIRFDHAFQAVMAGCAEATRTRPETWSNRQILDLYDQLFERGLAHSVECWRAGALVGGLYGVHLGGAFFGESMFSRERDASKTALVHLVAQLRAGGFRLLDTQFVTDHLARFGATEIPRRDYRAKLERALALPCAFAPNRHPDAVEDLLRASRDAE